MVDRFRAVLIGDVDLGMVVDQLVQNRFLPARRRQMERRHLLPVLRVHRRAFEEQAVDDLAVLELHGKMEWRFPVIVPGVDVEPELISRSATSK